MEPGICYIKSEYLLPGEKAKISNGKAKANGDTDEVSKRPRDGDSEDGLKRPHDRNSTEENPKKKNKNNRGKKEKRRGQNKDRPVFKEDRTQNLCFGLFNGPNGDETCTHPNCKYIHSVEDYMKSKPKDIGDFCYIYSTKGFCQRGLTCRFASAHLDENLNNMKLESYDPSAKSKTFNGINIDTQIALRKREYDFSTSQKIIQEVDDMRSERTKKETATQPKDNEDNTTLTKPIGCAIDDSDLKPCKVDFHNKLILSPLTTVGNLPFRRICKEFGADITCGEMACAVPLVKGLNQEWALTKRHESEDIFGVQICGNSPQLLAQVSQILKETCNIDYVDLNIGCPIELIYQQGGGSALIRRTNVLEAIVRSCSRVLDDIPFTVKTRTGIYADKSVAHELVPKMEEWGAGAVTIHGRSREQRYTKNSNWDYIEKCAAAVKRIAVIGNGDILTYEDYNEKRAQAPHVASVMIGRGALIKPWIFKEIKEQKNWDPTSSERFEMLRRYVNYGLEHWGSDTKGVETTRRFLLEWQSFLYRYVPYSLLENPPQKINQRPQEHRGRDEMETLMNSSNCADWIKLSEMLLGPVPDGFSFLPKHKANSYVSG